jgi:hypothetical protein
LSVRFPALDRAMETRNAPTLPPPPAPVKKGPDAVNREKVAALIRERDARAMERERRRFDEATPFACEPCTILTLTAQRCHWPLGDPSDLVSFRYCGAKISPGFRSYCYDHAIKSQPIKRLEALST